VSRRLAGWSAARAVVLCMAFRAARTRGIDPQRCQATKHQQVKLLIPCSSVTNPQPLDLTVASISWSTQPLRPLVNHQTRPPALPARLGTRRLRPSCPCTPSSAGLDHHPPTPAPSTPRLRRCSLDKTRRQAKGGLHYTVPRRARPSRGECLGGSSAWHSAQSCSSSPSAGGACSAQSGSTWIRFRPQPRKD